MSSIKSALFTPLQFVTSFSTILANAPLRSALIIPGLIGLLSGVVFVGLFFSYRQEIFVALYGSADTTISSILSLLFAFVGPVVAALLAIIVVLIVGAVFLDTLIARSFELLGVQVLDSRGISGSLKSLVRGIYDAMRWMILGLVILTISIFCSFIPPLWPVPFLLTAISLGFLLLDLPLSILGVGFGARIKLGLKHFLELLALGGCFSVLLAIPFGGILFLPIAYHVAVQKIVYWKKAK